LVFRVADGAGGPRDPIGRRLPELHGPPHPVLDALRVLPRVSLAVVAPENRLPKWDVVGDRRDGCARSLRFGAAPLAVALEPLGPNLRPLDEARILVV